MFLVIETNNNGYPGVGAVHKRDDWDEATELAINLVMDQQDAQATAEVRNELEADHDWADPNGEFAVTIHELGENQ